MKTPINPEAVVLQAVFRTDGRPFEQAGFYVHGFDLASEDGIGIVSFCTDWTKAMVFHNSRAAYAWVNTVSPHRTLDDGQPYYPFWTWCYGGQYVARLMAEETQGATIQ